MAETDRMQENTAPPVQATITHETEVRLTEATASRDVDSRLVELDREWDAERVLFTASGINALLGLALGRWVNPRWYGYVAAVAAFQLQHGLQGWCPPLAVIRRLKFRTQKEVDQERTALKALRGDFSSVTPDTPAQAALEAAQR